MNKAQAIQRSKLNSSYGGVGSTIDTIDNLSYEIQPFDQWELWNFINDTRNAAHAGSLKIKEQRLIERIKSIGFPKLKELFLTDPFEGDDVKDWDPSPMQAKRMVSSYYFPRMFYCPKCHKFHDIDDWKCRWTFGDWEKRVPKCAYCSKRTAGKVFGPNLVQVRFVLASMETGDFRDIPWNKVYHMKNDKKQLPNVWDFTKDSIDDKDVTFTIKKGSSDLIDIYVKSNNGIVVTMAEIMNHYFVLKDSNGQKVAYRPVIRSANNVYFSYTLSSVYIPKHIPTDTEIDIVRKGVGYGLNATQIKEMNQSNSSFLLSVEEIQEIVDNGFVVPMPNYSTEESFRLDEFDSLTNEAYYHGGVFDKEPDRLISEKYDWKTNPFTCIKQVYLLKRLNITTVQVAYSRIDKISPSYLNQWKGKSDNPKFWFDVTSNTINQNVEVALHPTCTDRNNVEMMPAVSSYGEGFFIELSSDNMPKDDRDKEIFLHTLSHLVMKSLEFYCGYPLSSMCERLYILPKKITEAEEDKYGFMIYSANGEAGSYGGITSLFETGKIETIIEQAFLSAEDCPNDPICEEEGGSCFACVQIPETACEMFNSKLSRNIVNDWYAAQTTGKISSTTTTASENVENEEDEGVILA